MVLCLINDNIANATDPTRISVGNVRTSSPYCVNEGSSYVLLIKVDKVVQLPLLQQAIDQLAALSPEEPVAIERFPLDDINVWKRVRTILARSCLNFNVYTME